jgi:hypothetical protein
MSRNECEESLSGHVTTSPTSRNECEGSLMCARCSSSKYDGVRSMMLPTNSVRWGVFLPRIGRHEVDVTESGFGGRHGANIRGSRREHYMSYFISDLGNRQEHYKVPITVDFRNKQKRKIHKRFQPQNRVWWDTSRIKWGTKSVCNISIPKWLGVTKLWAILDCLSINIQIKNYHNIHLKCHRNQSKILTNISYYTHRQRRCRCSPSCR